LPQGKGVRQRNKPPINKYSEKPTPKQDSWWTAELRKANSKARQLVDCRTDVLNLRTVCRLKLPHLMGEGADQAATAERQNKKKHYPHRPTMWQDYHRASA
jgi:hypothetical protein